MKKVTIGAVFLLFFVVFMELSLPVYSQGTLKSLGLQNVGLLPSNPFYFVKKWTRSIQRAFTTDVFAKIKFDWNVTNERAGELKKMAEVLPVKRVAILAAVDNYQTSLRYFSGQVGGLREIGSDAARDEFLDLLFDRMLKHTVLLEDLVNQFKDDGEVAGRLRQANQETVNFIASLAQKLDQSESFRARFQRAINNQDIPFREFRAAEILDRLEELFPQGTPLRQEADILKKDLILRFSVQLQQGLVFTHVDQTATDPLARLKILDVLRFSFSGSENQFQELRNQVNLLRQRYLDQLVAGGAIGSAEVQWALDRARAVLSQLQQEEGVTAADAEPVQFHVNQAEMLLQQINYSGAFNQALQAFRAADNLQERLAATVAQTTQELRLIRQEFDRLTAAASEARLHRAAAPEIFKLFDRVEILIGKIGDGQPTGLQEVKTLLTTIDLMLANRDKTKRPSP